MTDVAERVARACGIEVKQDSCGDWMREIYSWNPEEDERDAVLAAEKFGLFDKHRAELGWFDGKWCVWLPSGPGKLPHVETVSGNSFCEAICNAILALAEKGEGE